MSIEEFKHEVVLGDKTQPSQKEAQVARERAFITDVIVADDADLREKLISTLDTMMNQIGEKPGVLEGLEDDKKRKINEIVREYLNGDDRVKRLSEKSLGNLL